MTFLTSLSWTLYGGIVARDIDVFVPSLVGVMLASVQLAMYVLFGFEEPALRLVIMTNA